MSVAVITIRSDVLMGTGVSQCNKFGMETLTVRTVLTNASVEITSIVLRQKGLVSVTMQINDHVRTNILILLETTMEVLFFASMRI